jgi:hypothetical protein
MLRKYATPEGRMNTADDSELRDAIETAADALAQALETLRTGHCRAAVADNGRHERPI